MTQFFRPSFVLLAAFFVACTDPDARSSPEAGPADTGPDAQLPPEVDAGPSGEAAIANPSLSGSYELHFDDVALDTYDQFKPPLSPDMVARLDVQTAQGAQIASMTAPFGAPALMAVQEFEDRWVMTGTAVVGRVGCSDVDEVWNEIVLWRGGDGGLAGTFEATGVGASTRVNSMQGAPVPLTGAGRVTADTIAPQSRTAWIPEVGAGAILPWSRLSLSFNEGVVEQEFDERFHVSSVEGGASTALLTQWVSKRVGTDGESWVGLWQAEAALVEWDAVATGHVYTELEPGIADPAGNLAGSSVLDRSVVEVGPAVAAYDFSDGAPVSGTWGKARVLTGSEALVCESSSCLLLGPITISKKSSWATGFGGRLRREGGTRVVVRYRVLKSEGPGQGDDVLAHAVLPDSGTVVEATGSAPATVPIPLGEFAYASEWQDLVIELPAATQEEEIGISIRSSRANWDVPEASLGCGVDYFPHWYSKAIVLQSVIVTSPDGG